MTWHLITNWLTGHWLIGLPVVLALLACTPAGWAVLKVVVGTQAGRVACLLVIALGVGSWYGSTRYAAGVEDQRTATDAANAKAVAAQVEAEAARQGVFHSNEVAHAHGVEEGERRYAGVAADIAAGRYVLRASLRCPVVHAAAPAAEVGSADDAAAPSGVLPADTLLALVRLQRDADGLLERDRLAEADLDACLNPHPVAVTP